MRDVWRCRLIVPALALGIQPLDGDRLFKVTACAVPAGQAAVTHSHLSGFDYSREGSHVQIKGGHRNVVGPGRAACIDTGEEHTHAALAGAAFTLWFVSVRPEAQRGVPPVWPDPGARILGESAAFRVPPGGAWAEVLG